VDRALLDWAVRGGMFVLMFGMGLALTRDDFARIWLFPRAALLGSAIQLVAMPLVGVGLALAFGLPGLFAAGLVIVAACPGGTFSNLVVHLGRADTALSITLTATATAVALLTLPLWVNLVLSQIGGAGGDIQVPVLETAGELATFTLLPLALGMVLRVRLADPGTWERRLTRLGVLGVAAAMTSQALLEESETFAGYAQALPPVLALLGVGAALGYGLPLLARLPLAQSATIGVEVCLKNTVLGIALAELSMGLEAAVPAALYTIFHLPVSAGILVSYRLWARHRGLPLGRPLEAPGA